MELVFGIMGLIFVGAVIGFLIGCNSVLSGASISNSKFAETKGNDIEFSKGAIFMKHHSDNIPPNLPNGTFVFYGDNPQAIKAWWDNSHSK